MRQKKLRFNKMMNLGGKNYRAENITECNPSYRGPVVAIELFFIPKGHGWTVIRMDADNNQVGGGFYHWRKASALHDANFLAQNADALNDEGSGGLG